MRYHKCAQDDSSSHQILTLISEGQDVREEESLRPEWNEQVVFSEMFPPLCRRIKLQLKDKDSVVGDVIGTSFIDLAKISNDGNEGFEPTFGPSWINLYGSTRQYNTVDANRKLNEGFGRGCMFRGRLLVALKTDIQDSTLESGGICVTNESCLPISEPGCMMLQPGCMVLQPGCMALQPSFMVLQPNCMMLQPNFMMLQLGCMMLQPNCMMLQSGCMILQQGCMVLQPGCIMLQSGCMMLQPPLCPSIKLSV
ncbi:putative otoferlin [Apostichopus japonicus]|uniref:Putative otoferlin n=1 Tax=Stichopus japonicus TaxID=307972 RepID=A0A2G8KFX3_STIJA|nr:putative otoferlin [Apostichopus japonicus]